MMKVFVKGICRDKFIEFQVLGAREVDVYSNIEASILLAQYLNIKLQHGMMMQSVHLK